ncbi:MAG: Hsp20/alpha crystallin family protein [Marinicaulis sp.]|nr:Hsp20/alpha crystallin family protein [Marinicaulis sp.]NNL88512.1 Hsp20/alpha crystallin family protein [Marinicaulis sp.]
MFRPLTLFNRSRNAPTLRESDRADPFVQFHHEMNRLFDDFFDDFGAPSYFTGDRDASRPIHIDIHDKGKAFEIEAELPGVDEDDIDVELVDNVLTIQGKKNYEKTDQDGDFVSRGVSSFHRSMSLPFDVDPDEINAKFKNGVLKLRLRKPPELESRRKKISISRD